MRRPLALALLAALLSGCCNVRVSTEAGQDTIAVDNSSWRLFGLFALISGDPEYPNREVSVWFCDSLLLDVNMMLLDDAVRARGYRAFRNVSTYKTKENMFFLFSRHKLHTSAELVR